jgi:hypothetical protein
MSNNIKKPFLNLVEFLELNKDKKVSSILEDVKKLVESKKKDSTIEKDKDGKIVRIFCYYHKEWESVDLYGSKESSHSGFNTMCKIGVNQWTKQQSEFKKGKDGLMTRVISGDLKPENLQGEIAKLEVLKDRIVKLGDEVKKTPKIEEVKKETKK